MNNELLNEIKKELLEKKQEIKEHNIKTKRINQLEKDIKVKEYIELMGIEKNTFKLKKISDTDLIKSIYSKYLYKIRENETNGIFVCLGTYKYSDDFDIVHGGTDIRVKRDALSADYRLYCDIEQSSSVVVPISKCDEFEKNNIIIDPDGYSKYREFYKIQEDFFVRAVKNNQESAKKLVLKKYK